MIGVGDRMVAASPDLKVATDPARIGDGRYAVLQEDVAELSGCENLYFVTAAASVLDAISSRNDAAHRDLAAGAGAQVDRVGVGCETDIDRRVDVQVRIG